MCAGQIAVPTAQSEERPPLKNSLSCYYSISSTKSPELQRRFFPDVPIPGDVDTSRREHHISRVNSDLPGF